MLKASYYLCLAALVLGQFSLLDKSGDTGLYIFDFLIMSFAVLGLVSFLLSKRLELSKNYLPFFIFVLIALVSLIAAGSRFNLQEIFVGGLYFIRYVSYLLAGLVIFIMLKRGIISREELFNSVIISGLFLSFAGIVQLIVLPDFTVLDPSLGWDPHRNRLASTFFDPNFTGAYLTICLLFLWEKYAIEKRFSIFIAVSNLVIIVSLFLTFSRSAWLMLAIVIFIYGIFKSKTLLFSALVIAFLAYFAVPRVQTRITGATDPADSASLRLVSWKNAFEIAKDNLWLGVGFNTYRYAQRDYGFLEIDNTATHSGSGADSSLLFVLATTGIFGLAVYLFSLLKPIFENRSKVFYLALVGSLLVDSLFINSLFFPQILFLYFIALATV